MKILYITEGNIKDMKFISSILGIAFLALFGSCSTNDSSPIFQKDLVYDGYNVAMDTLFITTYSVSDIDSLADKKLHSTIVKWYDYSGFNSMTLSTLYTSLGVHETLEKITRDKNSLPIARDISVKSPNAETAVTLARLKKRKEGKEEWLFRYYLDPQKYLEDASYVFYSDDTRLTKKAYENTDSLYTIETDVFDKKGMLTRREPSTGSKQLPFLTHTYNDRGQLVALDAKVYEDNDTSKKLVNQYTETYKYELDDKENIIKCYTYHNDSLTSLSEYRYAYR